MLNRVIFQTSLCTGSDTNTAVCKCSQVASELLMKGENASNASTKVHGASYEFIPSDDPYKDIKEKAYGVARNALPFFERFVNTHQNPLQAAIVSATVANIMDFGSDNVMRDPDEFSAMLSQFIKQDMGRDDTEKLMKLIGSSKRVLYMFDNCGEDVIDTILIKQIQKTGAKVIGIVREKPALNDVTMETATEHGISDLLDGIYASKGFSVGLSMNSITDEIREQINDCDLIIAKGMANFEALSDIEDCGPIAHLLKAKCVPIARYFGVGIGSNIVYVHGDTKAAQPFSSLITDERGTYTMLPEIVKGAIDAFDTSKISLASKACIYGFGQSAIAGDFITTCCNDSSKVNIPTYSNETVPGWIDSDTAVIIVSYADDSPSVLNVYDKLLSRGCKIYCVTSGGVLEERCKQNGSVLIQLPKGFTRKSVIGFEIGSLISMVDAMGLCPLKQTFDEQYGKFVEYRDKTVRDIGIGGYREYTAEGSTYAIYGPNELRPAIKRMKLNIGDDTNVMSFWGELPEFNHNEIVGWCSQNEHADNLRIVLMKCNFNSEIQEEAFKSMEKVLSESGKKVVSMKITGENNMEKCLNGIMATDLFFYEFAAKEKAKGVGQRWK